MRLASLGRWLALTAWPLAPLACSSNTHCTCLVENNGERRTLACGDTACVGGTNINCAENDKSIVLRGACTAPPVSSEPVTGTPAPSPSTGANQSCNDLLTFCNTSCNSPASASSDCQATASSGDAAACAEWQLSSGLLCRP